MSAYRAVARMTLIALIRQSEQATDHPSRDRDRPAFPTEQAAEENGKLRAQLATAKEHLRSLSEIQAEVTSLRQRNEGLQSNSSQYEALVDDNEDRIPTLLRVMGSQVHLRQLEAGHDAYFEVEAVLLNASIFNLTITGVDGRIGFNNRWMEATIRLSKFDDFPLKQGRSGTVTIQIVPVQSGTIDALRSVARKYEWFEMNCSQIFVSFGRPDSTKETMVQVFEGKWSWHSDIWAANESTPDTAAPRS